MTHTERIDALLRGEPVDRLPVSFWRHFYLAERSGQGLAQAMLYFWRRYQWDFLKVNPRSTYQAEAWGVEPKYGPDEHSKEELGEWPVRETSDWSHITPLPPTEGVFAEQLDALQRLKVGLAGECYFIQTVFSPLATLGKLAGGPERVKDDMVDAAEVLHGALAAVTETLGAYVEEVLKIADGIFYATTIWAAGEHHAINWNVYAAGNADLLEVAKLTDKIIIGGVDHERVLLHGSPADVRAHVQGLRGGEKPAKFVVGPGCVIDTRTPDHNLTAIKAVL